MVLEVDMAKMITNKFPGKCSICSTKIAEGQGFAIKSESFGRWQPVCASSACIERAGGSIASSEEKKLYADGTLKMPKPDQAGLTLVRSMPRARFDWDRKVWTVSTQDADLARVIEIANQLGVEVDESLVARAKVGTEVSAEAEARAATHGLYEFQREGVRWLSLGEKRLLADDMGLGKTVQALVAIPEGVGALVICPKSVKRNWAQECEKWRTDLTPVVLEGKKAWREPAPGEVVIVNYDVLPRGETVEKTIETARGPRKIKEVQQSLPPNTVMIVDEAQLCKNSKTARHKRVAGFAKAAGKVWLLTGTPVENAAWDLKGVLEAGGMFRDVFGSFGKFSDLFGAHKNPWGGWEFGTPTAEVPERMRRVMLRRLKDDVLTDLPPAQYQALVVGEYSASLQRELDDYFEIYGEILKVGLPPFEDFSRIRARLAEEKIPHAVELVEEYEAAGKPLLVFSAHRAPVETIGSREGWAQIHGNVSTEERSEIVRRFQAGELRGIALTIRAGGVGLTLTRAADVLFVDRDWNPAWNYQAEDRNRRIGQTASSLLYKRLVTDHPLDKRVDELLEQKMALYRAAIENKVEYRPKVSPEIRQETQEELEARLAAAGAEVERAVYLDKIESVIERERGKGVGPEPVLTPERKELIRSAFNQMIGSCDGALTKDDVGFNKPDAAIAHWVARIGLQDDDELAFRLIERMLSRYKHTQLGEDYAGIWRAA